MPMMTRIKQILADPGKHLARARESAGLGALLAPFDDEEIARLGESYRAGELSKHVNARFAGAADQENLSAVFDRLSANQIEQLRLEHGQCGPCRPPPPR